MTSPTIENPRLSDRVAARILELALHGGSRERRLASERKLIAMLGVSRSTVKKALGFLVARGLVYRKRGSGTFLHDQAGKRGEQLRRRPAPRRLLVVAVPPRDAWWAQYYWREIRAGVLGLARRRALPVEIVGPDRLAGMPGADLRRTPVVLLGADDPQVISSLAASGCGRLVLVDQVARDLPVTSVVDGSFQGAREAVAALVRMGHRRIALLRGARANRNKLAGYRLALAEAGLPRSAEMVAVCERSGEQVGAAIRRLLALPDPATALFCVNDVRAVEALGALEGLGVRPGTGVAVMGFGDTAFRSGVCRSLSSVRIPLREMGERAFEEAVSGDDSPDGKVVILRDRLILRESTGQATAGSTEGGASHAH